MPATTAFSKHRTGQFPDRIERQGTVFAGRLVARPKTSKTSKSREIEEEVGQEPGGIACRARCDAGAEVHHMRKIRG